MAPAPKLLWRETEHFAESLELLAKRVRAGEAQAGVVATYAGELVGGRYCETFDHFGQPIICQGLIHTLSHEVDHDLHGRWYSWEEGDDDADETVRGDKSGPGGSVYFLRGKGVDSERETGRLPKGSGLPDGNDGSGEPERGDF